MFFLSNQMQHWLFEQILGLGRSYLPSNIWEEYSKMNVGRDIREAHSWLEENLKQHTDSTGIYLGLDTLNMEEGAGFNLEIGLSNMCNPRELNDDWIFDCEHFGKQHLIKGVYEVSDSFLNEEKWTSTERSFAEYLIFLGYSGVVLRDALKTLSHPGNFLSVWGFHDGDMFFLVQKIEGAHIIVSNAGY